MLSQLYIENIAVIRQATIDFQQGFHVFTGETGAGKTILISAINAVLGGRTFKEIIRTGETRATVSALFTEISEELCKKIEVLGYPLEDNQLLVQREIDLSGKGQCRLDGRPATAAMLREVCSFALISMVSMIIRSCSAPKSTWAFWIAMALTRRKWLLTPSLTKGCASVLPGWISFKWMKATSCSAWIFFSFKLRRSAMPS